MPLRSLTSLVFCSSANDWVNVESAQTTMVHNQAEDPNQPARISSLNILADCFPWFVELATCSKLRFQWLVQELETLDATVLCFNEATHSAIEQVMQHPFVRSTYFASECVRSSGKSINQTLNPHGCFILSKVPFESLSAFKWGKPFTKSSREVIVARVSLCGVSTVICATHTTAYAHHHKNRDQQISELKQAVEADCEYRDAEALFILGDLNLHCNSEDGIILQNGMLDLWAETHFDSAPPWNDQDPGYTFDSLNNKMIPRYIPGETRRMRLDRILLRQQSLLAPASKCVLWATEAVSGAHPEVFPSDHFGLSVEVQRAAGPTAGSEAAAAVLAAHAGEAPERHRRGLYANTVSLAAHAAWLLARAMRVV